MIQLSIDYDEGLDFWLFVVKEDGQIIHFRPGFRTQEDAARTGDTWIRDTLGGIQADASEPLIDQFDTDR